MEETTVFFRVREARKSRSPNRTPKTSGGWDESTEAFARGENV